MDQVPGLRQQWTGELLLRLSRERYRLCCANPKDGLERLRTTVALLETLHLSGELDEVLLLGRETLIAARCAFGDEHRLTDATCTCDGPPGTETGVLRRHARGWTDAHARHRILACKERREILLNLSDAKTNE